MNFRQLEVLRTLLATGSTVAAARVMELSQSGISRLLTQLEEELQITLFFREKGRLIPTPEAQMLARDAERILLGVERFNQDAANLRSGQAGADVVRLALPHSLWDTLAPAMLTEFHRTFPGVKVETFFETSGAIVSLIQQRVCEIGLLRNDRDNWPGIELEPIAQGVTVCVLHKDHPLTARDQITPRDLRGQPLILTGSGRPARLELEQSFHKVGVEPVVKIETHTNSSACAYAANRLGVTLISSFFANFFRDLPIVQRPFLPRMEQEFVIATPSSQPLSIATLGMIAALKHQLAVAQA